MTNWKPLAVVAALLVAVIWTLSPSLRGAQKKESTQPAPVKEAKKPATLKVEKKPFKIELALKGVLEGEVRHEIAHRASPTVGLPYTPGPLTIRQVVPHGSRVKKGDVLVAFDTHKIDQAIAQMEADIHVLEGNIKLGVKEQQTLEKSAPEDLKAAERAKREADEDLAYFLKIGKPEAEKRAHKYVKFAAFYYEYAKEQLRQLEKMYKSQDLTEETEQIILKRQRFFVEDAADDLRVAEIEREHTLKTILPRQELAHRESVFKQTLALEKARTILPLQLAQKQHSLAKMHFDRNRLANGLDMLRHDRQAMTLTAPADGVVYYGKFSAGQWENAASLAGKLTPFGTVNPGEVIMTIVQPRPLVVRVAVEEKYVPLVKAGLTGKVKLAAQPEAKVTARVTRISPVPTVPGKFEAHLVLANAKAAEAMPGMACSIHFLPYAQKQALVIPEGAVFEEDDKQMVEVFQKGKTIPRQVTVGRRHEGKVEILSGLTEGEEILVERPAGPKTEPAKKGSDL